MEAETHWGCSFQLLDIHFHAKDFLGEINLGVVNKSKFKELHRTPQEALIPAFTLVWSLAPEG